MVGTHMRAMAMGNCWNQGMGRSWGRGWRGGRYRFPVPLMLMPPVILGMGVAGVVVLSIGIALVATVAAVLFATAVTAGVFGILGFIAWQIVRHAVPGLRAHRRHGNGLRIHHGNGLRIQAEDQRHQSRAETPIDTLRRRYAAGEIGQTAFRRQLTDILKERYVRGDLTLAEFETRVRHLYSDPAVQPPA